MKRVIRVRKLSSRVSKRRQRGRRCTGLEAILDLAGRTLVAREDHIEFLEKEQEEEELRRLEEDGSLRKEEVECRELILEIAKNIGAHVYRREGKPMDLTVEEDVAERFSARLTLRSLRDHLRKEEIFSSFARLDEEEKDIREVLFVMANEFQVGGEGPVKTLLGIQELLRKQAAQLAGGGATRDEKKELKELHEFILKMAEEQSTKVIRYIGGHMDAVTTLNQIRMWFLEENQRQEAQDKLECEDEEQSRELLQAMATEFGFSLRHRTGRTFESFETPIPLKRIDLTYTFQALRDRFREEVAKKVLDEDAVEELSGIALEFGLGSREGVVKTLIGLKALVRELKAFIQEQGALVRRQDTELASVREELKKARLGVNPLKNHRVVTMHVIDGAIQSTWPTAPAIIFAHPGRNEGYPKCPIWVHLLGADMSVYHGCVWFSAAEPFEKEIAEQKAKAAL